MPNTDKDEAAQARTLLRKFLEDLRYLLEGLLKERPELFGSAHAQLLEVWDEDVKAHIDTAIAELDRTQPQASTGLPKPSDIDDNLRAHGLTGRQLDLKLARFGAALRAFVDELDLADEAERYWRRWLSRLRGSRAARYVRARLRHLRSAGRRAIQSKLGRVLRVANQILESLGDAIALVPAASAAIKAAKEFKDRSKWR